MSVEIKPATIKALTFSKEWHAATGVYPMLSAATTDIETGKRGAFMVKSFPTDSVGGCNWKAVHEWIDNRQGKANLYFSVNKLIKPLDKKAERTDIEKMVALHVDVDVRVGENQEEGIKRILNAFDNFKLKPSLITVSGGGAQAFWLLKEPIVIDGDSAKAEDAKLYNIALERALGGDACHNIDRIMRLPGTVNIPNETKRKKGRVPSLAYVHQWDPTLKYDLTEFEKAQPNASNTAASTGSKPSPSSRVRTTDGTQVPETDITGYTYTPQSAYSSIDPKDERLGKLPDRWRVMGMLGDTEGKYAKDGVADRSAACIAFACACVAAEVPDDVIAACLMDRSWAIGECIRDKKNIARELSRTIERAHSQADDEDIDRMNRDHCVMQLGGKYRIQTMLESKLHPGQREAIITTVEDFKFAHRREKKTIMVKERDENGNETGNVKAKTISLVDHWLRSPRCRQYDRGMLFAPQTDSPVINGALNTWQGFAFVPKPGDWSLMLAHIHDNLCNGNKTYSDYLVRWMAFIVQKRTRSEVAVLLRSDEEGSGKGFIAKHFGKLFGPHFMQVNNPEHVVGKFNPHLETLLLLNADEAIFAGDPRHRNAFWGLTTEEWITIEPKGYSAYKAKNHLNHIVTTNAKQAVQVNATARRIFALNVAAWQVGHPEYFDAIEDQLKAGGYEAMLYDLLHMDLTGFDVRKCPKTDALAQQQAYSRHGVDGLVEKALSEGVVPCPHYKWPGFSVTSSANGRDGFDAMIERSHDRELQQLGPLRVKRRLKQDYGCIIGDASQRRDGTARINGIIWCDLMDGRRAFEKINGPQEWLRADLTSWQAGDGDSGEPAPSGLGPAPKVKADDARIPF